MLSSPISFNVTVDPADNGMFVLICPSNAEKVKLVSWRGTATAEAIGEIATSDTPTQTRALRSAFKICNVTKSDNIEGLVRVCVLSSPIEMEWASKGTHWNVPTSFITELDTIATTNPKSRIYPAHSLAYEKKWVLAPASKLNMLKFKSVSGSSTLLDIQTAWENGLRDTSLCNVVLKFDNVTTSQNYVISFMEQTANRYPANTTLGTLQRPSADGGAAALAYASSVVISDASSHTGGQFGPAPSFTGGSRSSPIGGGAY